MGENLKAHAIVYFRTFYDDVAGRKRFGHLRASLRWRSAIKNLNFERKGRCNTPHAAWGQGYELQWPPLRAAA